MKLHRIALFTSLAFALAMANVWAAPNEDLALGVLKASDSSLEAKANACTDLSITGTAKSVPVLAKFLADEQLADYARNALEVIPDPSAGKALLDAASQLEGKLLTGVVITLGDRGEVAAVPVLQKMAADCKCGASDAALSSLGLIANDQAVETILALLKDGSGDTKIAAAHAALMASKRMKAAGKDPAALLAAVGAADVPGHIKEAAKGG